MASTVKGSFMVSMSDAWAKNERMVKRLDAKEGHYEGAEKAPKKRLKGANVEVSPNAVLGLDSDLFHMGGDMVTNMKEERMSNGDVNVYWKNARDGGIYVTRHEQVDDRGYRQVTKPRRIHSF